tara:strand:- start:431 stop:1249 length:819 start_codon:yes stop_codon:yes gene_type:complete
MEFDKLYLFFFDKEKKHKDFSDIEKSLDLITSDIFNKKNNIENLEKHRSKFLGNVSHEIKTPLFILQGYIDTLINGAVNDPEVNIIFLNKIKNQSLRLNNLMEDLITISMIESDELKLKIERTNFKEIVSFLDSDFSQILINRGDKLVFPDKIDHLFVDVDKENILIVFRNIINNAISYSDKGNVIISAKIEKNKLNIRIIDLGIGIDEYNIKRIFERFYRVDNDRSRKKGGTGLGLAIVKHILLAHKMTFNIESKLGTGSTFNFRLPISKT